ncbi:antimicrobial peptide NK-lysin-like [Garra rufa]|uniref:antimicrobial peptide NK-lysin-like n=1 Tax=Garra rufa TaxID=137080 RepID=UPI003CCE5ADE
MFRNFFLVSLLIYAVCAAHWEIREVDSAEDQDDEISADGMMEQQIKAIKCDTCKAIMKEVKKKISAKPTPDEIKTKLNNICDKFKLLRVQCKHFVEKYLQNLIDELMTDDGPNTICTKIHACKNRTIKEFTVVPDQAKFLDENK